MYDTLVTLKKGTGRTLKSGGMWVYDNEIESIAGDFENGDLVTVHDFDGYFLGIGFINTQSKITVRRTGFPGWWWISFRMCLWWSPWRWELTGLRL